jgi:hypothetical protein
MAAASTVSVDATDSTISPNDANVDGGGMYAFTSLPFASSPTTITGSLISDNTADADNNNSGVGGGIRSKEDLTVQTSVITGNTGLSGGGIHSTASGTGAPGNLIVEDSTISDNSATELFGTGGGIHISTSGSGDARIERSTISGNTANGMFGLGGGLYIYANGGPATIRNATISGNQAYFNGGGLVAATGTTTIQNSTITQNTSDRDNDGQGKGGGIEVFATLTLDSTIVAENIDLSGVGPDVSTPVSPITANDSLIGEDTGAAINGSNNIIGTAGSPEDPGLGPLTNNGGPTETHALQIGSQAIDAGANPASLATDQRGVVRTFGADTDIGAFEFGYIVDTANDEFTPFAGDNTLRDVLFLADGSAGMDDITFDPALAGQTLNLTLGELDINDGVVIRGLGQDDTVLDAGQNSRIFDAAAGSFDVELLSLTLTGGQAPASEDGGAVRFLSSGMLTVTSSTISGNSASHDGGGLYTDSGSVVIANSKISTNSAGNDGGAVHTCSGSVTVTGSAISRK